MFCFRWGLAESEKRHQARDASCEAARGDKNCPREVVNQFRWKRTGTIMGFLDSTRKEAEKLMG